MNTFLFIRPLLKSLDYDLPKMSLAVPHALFLGNLFWAFYTALYPWLSKKWLPQPLILPAEVYKVSYIDFPAFVFLLWSIYSRYLVIFLCAVLSLK